MDFTAFDTGKIDEYAKQARATWGKTEAYQEFTEKSKDWTEETVVAINKDFWYIFKEFGELRDLPPEDAKVQEQVVKLRTYITEHFYNCTPEILKSLGDMYSGGDSMNENIDKMGGEGTAEFAAAAITVYCEAAAR